MEISQEIRSKINQLDELSREIAEWFVDNVDISYDEPSIDEFTDLLQTVEDGITDFQESQNWI